MIAYNSDNSDIKQYNHQNRQVLSLPIRLSVGQQIMSNKHCFTQEEFDRFALLSGDNNPIHVDPVFASRTRFKRTVCHGMLLYSIICGFLSKVFLKTAQLEQNLMFPAPAFVRDEIVIIAEVVSIYTKQHRLQLNIIIEKNGGQIVCKGQTVLSWGTL